VDQLVPRPAFQAGGVAGVAVQLYDAIRGHARVLVQVVDVLGDDRLRLAGRHQARAGVVAGVRLAAGPAGATGEGAIPRLATLGLAADEIPEVDRAHLAPDPARTAEIGNAGLCGNAGPGEDRHAPRALDHVPQPLSRHHASPVDC